MASLFLRASFLLLGVATLAFGCGSTVNSVGSIGEGDSGALPSGGDAIAPPTGDDASATLDAHPDALVDAQPDVVTHACAAGPCGTKVCGRDECGHVCGICPVTAQGGCFVGSCTATCPGTPCIDHDGHQVCEGGRGGQACAGGTLGIQVCTCTGGGANAWINCGTCL